VVSTFINPVVNPELSSRISLFNKTEPIELRSGASSAEIEAVIRAVYQQVLGNAYVMEEEYLVIPESRLKQGQDTVRDFVRQVAKSELYRSRFFDNCYRYRTIELNFKHLLGRAPDSFDEMQYHSAILDRAGFETDIDSYVDSDEYQQVFGDNIVPYYRGYKTQPGQSLLEFTNMLQLLRSASSSDKDLTSGNRPRLTRSLIQSRPYNAKQVRDASEILAEVFKPKPQPPVVALPVPAPAASEDLQQQYQAQKALIETLQQQLAELRPFAGVGSAITRQGQFASAALVETQFTSGRGIVVKTELEQQVEAQETQITNLREQIAEARSLAAVGEARLNKWRQRTFF
jgi:phycoerythrin-associated linker protein